MERRRSWWNLHRRFMRVNYPKFKLKFMYNNLHPFFNDWVSHYYWKLFG